MIYDRAVAHLSLEHKDNEPFDESFFQQRNRKSNVKWKRCFVWRLIFLFWRIFERFFCRSNRLQLFQHWNHKATSIWRRSSTLSVIFIDDSIWLVDCGAAIDANCTRKSMKQNCSRRRKTRFAVFSARRWVFFVHVLDKIAFARHMNFDEVLLLLSPFVVCDKHSVHCDSLNVYGNASNIWPYSRCFNHRRWFIIRNRRNVSEQKWTKSTRSREKERTTKEWNEMTANREFCMGVRMPFTAMLTKCFCFFVSTGTWTLHSRHSWFCWLANRLPTLWKMKCFIPSSCGRMDLDWIHRLEVKLIADRSLFRVVCFCFFFFQCFALILCALVVCSSHSLPVRAHCLCAQKKRFSINSNKINCFVCASVAMKCDQMRDH